MKPSKRYAKLHTRKDSFREFPLEPIFTVQSKLPKNLARARKSLLFRLMAAIAIFQRNCSTIEFKKQSKPILTGFGCFFIKCRVQKTSEISDVVLLGIDLIAESLAQKENMFV